MSTKGNDVILKKHGCEIRKANSGKLVAYGTWIDGNLYTLTKTIDGSYLWHKRLGHINFDNIANISSRKVVRDIPCISNPSNHICPSCQKGK